MIAESTPAIVELDTIDVAGILAAIPPESLAAWQAHCDDIEKLEAELAAEDAAAGALMTPAELLTNGAFLAWSAQRTADA